MTRAMLLALALLSGCASATDQDTAAAIVLDPEAAAAVRPTQARVRKPAPPRAPEPAPAGADSPAAVIRDNEALAGQAVAYVVAPNSRPAVIDRLSTLSAASARSVARLRAQRTRAGYREADVAAARAAADALAAYLATQARPLPPAPAP